MTRIATTRATQPREQLPDTAPLLLFFLPNFLGILLATGLEKLHLETLLQGTWVGSPVNRYCWLAWGVFAAANVNSFLGGRVVRARVQYNVKLPHLYAANAPNQNGIQFDCVQRSHQNFIETYAQVVLVTLFTAFVADRPNTAGGMLLLICLGRVLYALGYSRNISDRMAGQLLAIFTMSIGVGYAFLIGCSGLGWNIMNEHTSG